MNKSQGFLIAIEGGEGAGKTTQVALLVKKLKRAGHEAVGIREPGGDKIAEQIRAVVLNRANTEIVDTTETLLFMAARAQIYAKQVLPALQAGKVVVMDRSRDSSVVYQGIVRGQGAKLIEKLNDIATQDTRPDLKIFLDVPVNSAFSRLEEKDIQRFEDLGKKFHRQVYQDYLQLVAQDQERKWVVVNGDLPQDEVSKLIWNLVAERLT